MCKSKVGQASACQLIFPLLGMMLFATAAHAQQHSKLRIGQALYNTTTGTLTTRARRGKESRFSTPALA